MNQDLNSKIDTLAQGMGQIVQRADALMDKFETNEENSANICAILETKVKLLTQNIEWTVGSNATFSNLKDALMEAAKYANLGFYKIDILLKNGFSFDESLHIYGLDLSHVVIRSEADYVDFNGSMSANNDFINQYNTKPMAISFIHCSTPLISFKLRFSSISDNLTIAFGFLSSIFRMKQSGVFNQYWGVAGVSSFGFIQDSIFTNCTNCAILADNASIINAYHGNTLKTCSGNILWSADSSKIYAGSIIFDGIYENKASNCACAHIVSELGLNNPQFINMQNARNSTALNVACGGRLVISTNAYNTIEHLNKSNISANTYSPTGQITLY